MIDLTLTFPTRGRSHYLPAFFRNIMETIGDPSKVEIIIQYDEDDTATQNVLQEQKQLFPSLPMVVIEREHGANLSDHYYNWLIDNKVYRGKYMWVGGDDLRILTPNWDRLITKAIEGYLADKRDRICYAFPKDKSLNKPMRAFPWGWFPILTRETIDTLGFFFPRQVGTWGADLVLADLFNDPGIHRSLPITNVVVDHIGYHAYNMPKDKTAHSMSERFNSTLNMSTAYRNQQMSSDKEKLRNAIG